MRVVARVLATGVAGSVLLAATGHAQATGRDTVIRATKGGRGADSVPHRLSTVTVTPGEITLLQTRATSQIAVTRDAILARPALAEDLFRMLSRLPGLSGSDFTAKIRIRNGGVDEQLHLLDGMELIEPFHLKDFDGALTILDGESIGQVTITTGGFTSRYGNRQAGLIEMLSDEPQAGAVHGSVGLSITNLRGRAEGTFADDRGAWLVAGRRGYLNLALQLARTQDPPDPRYSDLFAKVRYRLTSAHTLTLHGLVAGDKVLVNETDGSFLTSRYGNGYLWATLESQLGARVTVRTLVSGTHLSWDREVVDIQTLRNVPYTRARIDDVRGLNGWSVKQDWTADLTPALAVLAGAELRSEGADFTYFRKSVARALNGTTPVVVDSTSFAAALDRSGRRTSAYLSVRARPQRSLTMEVGVRADRFGWTDQATVGPRVNAAWSVRTGTTVRAAWGHFFQGQALQDLSVVDGDTLFQRAERAEQRVVGVEQVVRRGWTARVEAYQRLMTTPRARYINVDGLTETPLPEGKMDRVRFAPSSARVQGVELVTQYDRGGRWSGGAALALSSARAVIGGVSTPRPFDEPVSGTLDFSWRGSTGWTIAAAFTARSGWPTSSPRYAIDTLAPRVYTSRRVASSPLLLERLGGYQRVDVRATKVWMTARGRVTFWLDLFNVFKASNLRGYTYRGTLVTGPRVTVTRDPELFLGRLPTAGLRWEF